jgi:hypothetical protein
VTDTAKHLHVSTPKPSPAASTTGSAETKTPKLKSVTAKSRLAAPKTTLATRKQAAAKSTSPKSRSPQADVRVAAKSTPDSKATPQTSLITNKPATPMRQWENVPRSSTTRMSTATPTSAPASHLRLNEPTYLPYSHSRDLLAGVQTLQSTCNDLSYRFIGAEPLVEALRDHQEDVRYHNHLLEQVLGEHRYANTLRQRQNEISDRILEKSSAAHDGIQQIMGFFDDIRQ